MDSPVRVFQYFKNLDIPLYIKVPRTGFQNDLYTLLVDLQFTELTDKELATWSGADVRPLHGRVLSIKLASPNIAKQLAGTYESDRFGKESIVPGDNYKVYRYKEKAMMVYSSLADEWELGCLKDFGDKASLMAYRTIINRFLALALAPLGIGGFWGVPVEEGVVVLRPMESLGEAFFVDYKNSRLLTIEGVREIDSAFVIIRLDNMAKRERTLSPEELYGLLSVNCNFLDYNGMTVPIRQVLHSLCSRFKGMMYPKSSFKPRMNINL